MASVSRSTFLCCFGAAMLLDERAIDTQLLRIYRRRRQRRDTALWKASMRRFVMLALAKRPHLREQFSLFCVQFDAIGEIGEQAGQYRQRRHHLDPRYRGRFYGAGDAAYPLGHPSAGGSNAFDLVFG